MKAVSRVWSVLEVYVQAMSFLLALFCVFTIAAPQASAAAITTTQLDSISKYLVSLHIDQASIDRAIADLRTATVEDTAPTSSTPIPPVLSSTTPAYTFVASPTSGQTPLDVMFTVEGAISNALVIYFGDGATSSCKSDQCSKSTGWSLSHLYAKPGTYTAQLFKPASCSAPQGAACAAPAMLLPIASATITVTDKGASSVPTCTLRASETSVGKGSSVTLTWTSKNADSSSTVGGGRDGKPQGSIKVKVDEDTTYVKRVYGAGGEGECAVSIDVWNDRDSTTARKVVWNPFGSDVIGFVSSMQVGAVLVAETFNEAVQNAASVIMGFGSTSSQSRKMQRQDRSEQREFPGTMPVRGSASTSPTGRGMTVQASSTSMKPLVKIACLDLRRTLKNGSQDTDKEGEVGKLQQFLGQDPSVYNSDDPVGYFGSSTERALKKWQMMKGLVASSSTSTDSGAGLLGPKTRALLAFGCKNMQQASTTAATTTQNAAL